MLCLKFFIYFPQPPSMVYLETTVAKYRVGYRLHEPNPQRNPNYLDIPISSSARSYLITGLDEYTLYDLRINAVDGNGFNREPYLETRRTSAKRKKIILVMYTAKSQ